MPLRRSLEGGRPPRSSSPRSAFVETWLYRSLAQPSSGRPVQILKKRRRGTGPSWGRTSPSRGLALGTRARIGRKKEATVAHQVKTNTRFALEIPNLKVAAEAYPTERRRRTRVDDYAALNIRIEVVAHRILAGASLFAHPTTVSQSPDVEAAPAGRPFGAWKAAYLCNPHASGQDQFLSLLGLGSP